MIVAVIGPPRSGSSMVAGVLHNLGVSMGRDMLPADRWNQLGYFEDRQFLALHRVMTFPHGDARRVRLTLPADEPKPTPSQIERHRLAVAARCDGDASWGIKGPKLAFVYDELVAALPDPRSLGVVFCDRPMAPRIASLMAMFGVPRSEAAFICGVYDSRVATVKAKVAAEGTRSLEVGYEEAMRRPADAVDRIAEFVGVAATAAAKTVVDPKLRRHVG